MTMPDLMHPTEARTSLTLAAVVTALWLGLHVLAVWHLEAQAQPLLALAALAGLTWLSTGLFIIAHDAMHGTVAPGRPRLNAAIGQVTLWLFAGFSWRRLIVKHMAHHRHAGTDDDPDFGPDAGRGGAARWYLKFLRTYFGWREALLLGGVTLLYALILGPRWPYIAFWSLPAILASMQLFYFGTYLPHMPRETGDFPDRHRARSSRMSDPVSLLSCFHFGGYHHEHHLYPHVPWWRLPRTRCPHKEAAK
ncbi:MAG: fatty acid desaturase [Paracoccus sp. (in: a-proteobacteria)]|uniref:fatty acid desaturase n=1 Tax=Paracoccus sp. TaxID=267 RepID=UPI00391929F5